MLKAILLALFLATNSEALEWWRIFQTCDAQRHEPWSYRGLNGPAFWGLTYSQCYGWQQSPININTTNAVTDENLPKLTLENYGIPLTQATIENNGHSIEIVPQDGVSRTISINGDTYSLEQFHFHWGKNGSGGSEHTIDGLRYTMEMHLVHMNENEDIAVVGVFFEEQDNDNEELQKIVDQLSQVLYKGDEVEFQSSLNLNSLLPANPTSFYRYVGSLTTPECLEGVTWSVAPDPIPVGRSQMEEFRKVYSTTEENATNGCKLSGNYRPVQPLFGRQVYKSSE